VDLLRYADASAALLNADLTHVDGLVAHLAARPELQRRATDRDCMLLRKVQRELRPVFDAAAAARADAVVDGLNALLAQHPITPQLSVTGSGSWAVLGVALGADDQTVAELVTAEALLGLLEVVSRLGTDRLGSCAAAPCTRVFVDTSPNHTRRYCSERCATRANVAAYRARRRGGG
jgi:predicted RNA-binding Zn ribbon-like protein